MATAVSMPLLAAVGCRLALSYLGCFLHCCVVGLADGAAGPTLSSHGARIGSPPVGRNLGISVISAKLDVNQVLPLSSHSLIKLALLVSHSVSPLRVIGRAAHLVFVRMLSRSASFLAWAVKMTALTAPRSSSCHPGAPVRQAMPDERPQHLSLATFVLMFRVPAFWH